ncbi:glycoside hydrolase family protein [Hyphomonadaceae bacterium ML37]|nr:glycoside hydrolase family protein [Hyphomonadaceae bacterium ML37]
MKPRLKSTRAARDLIKTHEPFLGEAQRRGRRWLVGYGHSAAAKEGVILSRENAELLLIYDVLLAEQAVEAAVGADLPAPMRDALVSFAASVGANAFKVSDVARLTRAGKHREAAAALETWVRAEEGGRLVVSERLVRRRAAEKALFLTALDAPAEAAAPASAPAPAPQDQPEPAPRLGPLVEVDIAFEDWSEAAAAMDAPASADEPAAEPEPVAEADPETEAVAEIAPDAEAEPEAEAEAAPVLEPAPEPQLSPMAARTEQVGAVQAVLARMAASMAGDAARAPEAVLEPEPVVEVEPHNEPAALSEAALDSSGAPASPNPVLGFSFLTPAIVTAPVARKAATTAPEPVHQPAPEPAVVEAKAASPVLRAHPAPPHPGEAPARAAGLSGEVEGPERPEGEYADTAHEDDAALEPAHVAGAEAMAHTPEAAASEPHGGGVKIFIANLVLGVLMAGLGASMLAANFETYMAEGIRLSDDWPAPALFVGGVLMVVASGLTLAGRLKERRARRA